MKKVIIIIIGFISLVNTLFAQKEMFFKVNAGYNFKMSSLALPDDIDFYNLTRYENSSEYKTSFVSLGKGLNFDATFGYMFNKNIGTDLKFSYLLGSKNKAKYENLELGNVENFEIYSNMLQITPSLIISTNIENLNFYTKLGLVLGMGSVNYKDEYAYNNVITNNYTTRITTVKFNGGISVGLNTIIGINFKLNENDKIMFFGEINMINMSYAPNQATVIDDNDFEFLKLVNSYSTSSNNNVGLKYKFPFGSIGLNFGMRFSL